jgi:hypothetical protein
MRKAVQGGQWVLDPPGGQISGRTDFQRRRLTEAVTAARVYLSGSITAKSMGQAMGVTHQQASQVVRLGISYMQREEWLRPAPKADSSSQSSLPPALDRDPG